MNVGIKNAERVRLTKKNTKMFFSDVEGNRYSYNVDVDRYLGEGSSCICYEVTVYKDGSDWGQKRVLKQFYPEPKLYEIDVEMTGIQLDIKGYTEDCTKSQNKELSHLGIAFEKAVHRQMELSNKEKLSEFIVKPDLWYFENETKYILYESDYGQSLNLKDINSIEEFINKMYELAFGLQQLHKQGILYMDLKPSNILVSGGGKIKLFDFDASINMENLSEIHARDIRCDAEHPGLTAPELREMVQGEFEQNKKLFLNEKVDIYSFGAILFSFFFDRYPEEKDWESGEYRKKISELFNGRYRGELTDEEIMLLNRIIWKCIQKFSGRYSCTEELLKDLKNLKDSVNTPIAKRRRVYHRVSGQLQSACVMDGYPLSKYRRKADNEWILDSLIIGNDEMGDAFLSNIFGCTQMLDTKNVIRIAVSAAEEKMKQYIEKWPLLAETSGIFLNDVLMGTEKLGKSAELNLEITKSPFAEMRFYEWNIQMDPLGFMEHLEQSENISWIIVCDSELAYNKKTAEKIAEKASENTENIFIGYLDDRGDGYDLRHSEKRYGNVELLPFGCNNKYTEKELKFDKGIRKQAFLLHRYYMREWNECANAKTVEQNFRSEAYNIRSSLSSVLSIPYKLESIGIKTLGSNAAEEYKKLVLDKNCPDKSPRERAKAQTRFNQLIYLEHRRWMCFMVTEGYRKPEEKALKQYAFRGTNDQRNKTDKLHPCICDCGKENGICLDRLPHEAWTGEIQSHDELDELDTMSVQFHRLCNRRIDQLVKNGEFAAAFRKLERAMKSENCQNSDYELLNSVKMIGQKMLDNESNINQLWEKICTVFNETIEIRNKKSGIHTTEVKNAFDALKNMMRVVKERNSYHDYKSSDRTILEILPLLLIYDQSIRRIHKPVAGKTWQNIASSLIIEPEELYLYTDEPACLEIELMRSFLEKERGVMKGKSIVVKTMDDLKKLKITQTTVKSVLDITGLSAEEVYKVINMENIKKLPLIIFKNGKICSLNGKTEADYYSGIRRHLSVAETFRLYHAKIHSEDSQNHMLALASNYENLWSAYLKMNSFRYKILVEILNQIEAKHYWKLEKKESTEKYEFEKKSVSHAMIQDAGIDKLLSELRKDKWIENGYCIPDAGKVGGVSVKTKYPEVLQCFEKMFKAIETYPYMHGFVYMKTYRTPLTGEPSIKTLYYIYDETLLVDEIVMNKRVLKDNVNDKKENARKDTCRREVLEKAFEIMGAERNKQKDGMIIEGYGNNSDIFLSDVPGEESKFQIKFVYQNRATKECLMKEGNILEAYVYYTIWKNVFVDDVQLNTAFTWDAESSQEALVRGAITNEIDLVCTKNMQTYFISCKQSMPKTEYLQEIKYFADYFGIDGKAILVTSNGGTSGKQDRNDANLIASRSQKMQVYYIDRKMMGDDINDMRQGYLLKYIQNIFDGKRDWKDI